MPSAPTPSAFKQSYNSISGIDIKAVFASKVAVPLQAVSYAIQREKAPIYTMGFPNPRAFSRGKRGIAGSLIFVLLDKHPLVASGQGLFSDGPDFKFWADMEEIRPSVATNNNVPTTGFSLTTAAGAVPADDTAGVETDNLNDQVFTQPWYVDQIPPFDITLTGSNEQGTVVSMAIIGVELVNEGYGISIDDLVSEYQYTFVAREVLPWTRLPPNTASGIGSTAA